MNISLLVEALKETCFMSFPTITFFFWYIVFMCSLLTYIVYMYIFAFISVLIVSILWLIILIIIFIFCNFSKHANDSSHHFTFLLVLFFFLYLVDLLFYIDLCSINRKLQLEIRHLHERTIHFTQHISSRASMMWIMFHFQITQSTTDTCFFLLFMNFKATR